MNIENLEIIKWIGILLCITQSACFSGLNLAVFGVSRLRLEIESDEKNDEAVHLLNLRQDSNYLLATILWGNVSVNCLLTILTDSVLTGALGFFFSTGLITIFGEIIPQAYFSRNALRVVKRLAPLLSFYQVILWPLAKPTSLLLNGWLGLEGTEFFRERYLQALLRKHVEDDDSEVGHIEGTGASNFLKVDDLLISEEGELLHEGSVIFLPTESGKPVFPSFAENPRDDAFVKKMRRSGMKWVIIVDEHDEPIVAIDTEEFLSDFVFKPREKFNPHQYSHHPIVVRDPDQPLGDLLARFRVHATHAEDDVIDQDVILLWHGRRRIITGSDILGRLLRGIVQRTAITPHLSNQS